MGPTNEPARPGGQLPSNLAQLNETALGFLKTDPSQGIALLEPLLRQAGDASQQPAAEPAVLGACYLTLGRLHMMIANYGTALHHYAQALQFYQQAKDASASAVTRSYIGIVYAHMGEFAQGLEHLFAALQAARDLNDRFMAAEITNDISYCYVVMGQPQLALENLLQVIPTLRELGDKIRLGWALDSLGMAYLRSGDLEKALASENECIQLAEEMQSWQDMAQYLINSGEMQRASGDPNAAEQAYRRALEVARQYNYRAEVAKALLSLGQLYIAQERSADAIPLLEEALSISDNIQRLQERMECLQTLADAHERCGDYSGALAYYKEFNRSRERLYNEEADRRMKNLQVMHQLENARSQAATYLRQNKALQQEIAVQKRNQAVLERLARMDALTNVLNRRAFFEAGQRYFKQARAEGKPLTVVMLDLDHFKQVNDRFGHMAGDQTLAVLTERLRHHLRSSDALARYGGEEFVILLPDLEEEQAFRTAERLRMAVNQAPFVIQHTVLRVTISLGVASAQNNHYPASFRELVRRADRALYAAKHAGRNCTRLYSETQISPNST